MVEELAERHHGDTLEIPAEAPTNQMYIQPPIVILGDILLRYDPILPHDQLKLLPLLLELPQAGLTRPLHGLISQQFDVLFRPKTQNVDISGHVLQHFIPDAGFAGVGEEEVGGEHSVLPVRGGVVERLFPQLVEAGLLHGDAGVQEQLFWDFGEGLRARQSLIGHHSRVLQSVFHFEYRRMKAWVNYCSLVLQQLNVVIQRRVQPHGWARQKLLLEVVTRSDWLLFHLLDLYKGYIRIEVMSTGEYLFKRSLSQCIHSFEMPACAEQVCFDSLNLIICAYAWFAFAQRYWYERIWRLPKAKQVVLFCLAVSTLFELVYETDFRQHWSYYTSVFFDDLYFAWVVYYFGKKCLNAMGYHNLLKYYRIALGVLIGLFSGYYIYNLARDSMNQNHRMCFDPWYTYSRVLVLLLEFALCVIGCCIHNKLNQKITYAMTFSHEQTIERLLKKHKKEMSILIILIVIFLISEIVLLVEAIIFQANHSLNCQFFAHNPTANFFTTFPILLFGYYIPRVYTIWVFRFNVSLKRNNSKPSKLQESLHVVQLAVVQKFSIRQPNALVEESMIDNHTT